MLTISLLTKPFVFVKANKSKPFFLYWSMVVPHANNERNRELKNGAEVPDFGPYAEKDWPEPDRGQAAMVTRMDSYVGRMLDTLRDEGLAENTLVISPAIMDRITKAIMISAASIPQDRSAALSVA